MRQSFIYSPFLPFLAAVLTAIVAWPLIGLAQPARNDPPNPPENAAPPRSDGGDDAGGLTARFGPETTTVPVFLVDFLTSRCDSEITLGTAAGVKLTYRVVRHPADFTALKLSLHVRKLAGEITAEGAAIDDRRWEPFAAVPLELPATSAPVQMLWPARVPGHFRFRLVLELDDTHAAANRVNDAESRRIEAVVHPRPESSDARQIDVQGIAVTKAWRELAGGRVRVLDIEIAVTVRFQYAGRVECATNFLRRGGSVVRSPWAGVMPPVGVWQPQSAENFAAGEQVFRQRFTISREMWPRELWWRIDGTDAAAVTAMTREVAAMEAAGLALPAQPEGAERTTIALVKIAVPQFPADSIAVSAFAGSPFRSAVPMRQIAVVPTGAGE